MKQFLLKLLSYLDKKTTLVCALCILTVFGMGAVLAPKQVVIYGSEAAPIKTATRASSVQEVLSSQEVALADQAYVIPGLDAEITNGMEIYVFNTFPIKIYLGDEVKEVQVPIMGLKQLLYKEGIVVNEHDRIESNIYGPDQELYLEVLRVSTEIIEKDVPVDFNTILQPNHDLYRGDRRVVLQGARGQMRQLVEITYENDEPINEKVLSEELVLEPVDQVLEFGTQNRIQTASRYSGPGSSLSAVEGMPVIKEMIVESTAYTHTGNTTFTSIWPYEGIVAVDPKVIPLGTKMYVEGYGFAEAQDTGGLIKGEIIDVFMDTYEKAVKWGRRDVKIYILEYPE